MQCPVCKKEQLGAGIHISGMSGGVQTGAPKKTHYAEAVAPMSLVWITLVLCSECGAAFCDPQSLAVAKALLGAKAVGGE